MNLLLWQLKCSGNPNGCQRCEASLNVCTYRVTTRGKGSSRSKGPPTNSSSSSSPTISNPSPKAQTWAMKAESNQCTLSAAESSDIANMDTYDELLSTNSLDSFWTALTPLAEIDSEKRGDGSGTSSQRSQDLSLELTERFSTFPIMCEPEESLPLRSTLVGPSTVDPSELDDLTLTSPITSLDPVFNSFDPTEGLARCRCDCVQSLANILESISGNDGSSVGQAYCFDEYLKRLRDGTQTCQQAAGCKSCYVCTTNPMIVVSFIQQLANLSQDLSHRLLTCHQSVNSASSGDLDPLLLEASMYVGQYQAQSPGVYLECIFAIANVHLLELHRLVDHLRKDLVKGARAQGLLADSFRGIEGALGDLRDLPYGRLSTITLGLDKTVCHRRGHSKQVEHLQYRLLCGLASLIAQNQGKFLSDSIIQIPFSMMH